MLEKLHEIFSEGYKNAFKVLRPRLWLRKKYRELELKIRNATKKEKFDEEAAAAAAAAAEANWAAEATEAEKAAGENREFLGKATKKLLLLIL